jgi:hypothetical protein
MLFANGHAAGRTFILDVRDALHPKIATSFSDMDGCMHPHSYLVAQRARARFFPACSP